ncbi:MAG TPA: mandelate racemase/muconate lactonizing enzyme family protein [Candidatus Tectomicrobia bacterium]|nr:mandelate racemase/muconate lactonizing enzyme family protein [Candidatus Tectomicrobia bacterium]
MNVTDVQVEVLQAPVEHPYTAAGRRVEGNWHVLARLTTNDGIEGAGYIVSLRQDLVQAVAQATRELGRQLIGVHVLEVEAAWARLASVGNWIGPGGLLHIAIAPLDIALWDAAGKTLGQPLYRLLGGYRDRVPAYASDRLWYSLSLDELAASARQHVADGFRAVKLRLGKEARSEGEVARIHAVRRQVGADIAILVDATESWDRAHAIHTSRLLQEAGIAWLEDPLPHQDMTGLSQLAGMLDVPVAGGEHLYDLATFRDLFQHHAVDIAIIDLARVGGITPWRRIAALAQAYHVPVCGHVIPEVHVHLLSAIPNALRVEYVPRSAAILRGMPALEDGCLVAPKAPGLGLEFDEAAMRRYRVG